MRYLVRNRETGQYYRGGYHTRGWTTKAKATLFRSKNGVRASMGWRIPDGELPPYPTYDTSVPWDTVKRKYWAECEVWSSLHAKWTLSHPYWEHFEMQFELIPVKELS